MRENKNDAMITRQRRNRQSTIGNRLHCLKVFLLLLLFDFWICFIFLFLFYFDFSFALYKFALIASIAIEMLITAPAPAEHPVAQSQPPSPLLRCLPSLSSHHRLVIAATMSVGQRILY